MVVVQVASPAAPAAAAADAADAFLGALPPVFFAPAPVSAAPSEPLSSELLSSLSE